MIIIIRCHFSRLIISDNLASYPSLSSADIDATLAYAVFNNAGIDAETVYSEGIEGCSGRSWRSPKNKLVL
ncbi:MAG: hypothetical protein VR69_00765 [Peptococcaceae bacterium BRH_c4b]|nr:MAG: hypothetical protein VR69_00765 [Peptococcaceae bacterium BRH_c4b]